MKKTVEKYREYVLTRVELPQPQHFGHRLIFGPAHRRHPRALASDAGQHQKQAQFR